MNFEINHGWLIQTGWYSPLPAQTGDILLNKNNAAVFVVGKVNSHA
jgi:hypothetical protein